MKGRTLYIVLGILGVLFFSTKAVFVKLAYAYGVDTVSLLLLRMTFSLPFYVGTILILGKPDNPTSKQDYSLIVLFGLLGYYLASYFDFLGLLYIKASLERLILFIYPSLVLIISMLFLKKSITKVQVIALAVSYVGIGIVFAPELQASDSGSVLLGGSFVFISALCYASYIVGSGWMIPRLGATRFTSYCMTVSCLLIIGHYFVVNGGLAKILELPTQVYIYALLMAFISTVIPSYLISFAIKGIGANQFAIFASMGPVSTIVLAYFLLNERLTLFQLCGGLVVIGGIMIAESKKAKRQAG